MMTFFAIVGIAVAGSLAAVVVVEAVVFVVDSILGGLFE
jgi:hypothetical protein